MNSPAESAPGATWSEARGAYRLFLGDDDPAGSDIEAGAIDLRPGWDQVEFGSLNKPGTIMVISGADDLQEIRLVVERMTGPGTWTPKGVPPGFEPIATRRATVGVVRPAPAMALVMAMNGLIDDRSAAWRTWRTVVESVARGLEAVDEITIEAVIVDTAT